ncbi:MAG: hemerythrin domain-containing protein [Dehalococcoidia bacterium]|jgi:hemerythrin-like domain-containing protein|nr:hemerythrin domain-containing protein [Dehalococcoidia bacterium]MEB2283409.1 hemerythrin domain-containing protein [Myxococcales bacterium]
MDVTQALLGEHGVVHLLVEQLEEVLERYHTATELRAAAEPLAITLLGHARIEDEALFQPYEKQTGSLGPLKCLRHEHELMDRQIRVLFRLQDPQALRAQIRALLDVIRRHLAREEEVMFKAARDAIDKGELEHLGHHWAEFRGVKLGD